MIMGSHIGLTKTGEYGTAVSWSSSKPKTIRADGSVQRSGKDVPVTLTARITKGRVSYDAQIKLTVKGKSKSS